jgi:hypothetical protein
MRQNSREALNAFESFTGYETRIGRGAFFQADSVNVLHSAAVFGGPPYFLDEPDSIWIQVVKWLFSNIESS